MISLSRVSAKMGRHYYTSDSYYTKDGSIENSQWFGKGSKILGLEGHVDPKTFQNLLDEYSKKEQTPSNKNVRVALDLTLSAPKSVSLACLVGNDTRLLEAHNEAVQTALRFVEERYSYTRTGSKENRKIEVTGNIIAAQFTHDVSREKDPQLHTHCVIFNKVKRCDGKWRSFHNDGIFNNSKLVGLVYQNDLAFKAQKLGYEVQINSNGTFEIKGYSREQLVEFSKRTQKINSLHCKTKKQERIEKLLERPSKGKAISRDILRETWFETANQMGIVHPKPQNQPQCENEFSIRDEVFKSVNHVTERDVRFKKEDLEKFTLTHNLGKQRFDSKKYSKQFKTMIIHQDLIEYKKGHFTTKDCLNIESRIIEKIKLGKKKFQPIVENIPEYILNNDPGFTKGQQESLINVLKSQDQFIAWQGVAGAGKTFAMNFLRGECEKQNVILAGFSQSKEAANILHNESKIPSHTVASLLVKQQTLQNGNNQEIWIVDEAGLLGAKDCEKLMEKAIHAKARVILIGDTNQMPAIQAGNPFRLIQNNGISVSHLNESIRQKTKDLKEAVHLVSQNKIKDGLLKIEDRIFEYQNAADRYGLIQKSYLRLNPSERRKSLILCSTNEEKKVLTANIRQDLFRQNQLKNEVMLTQLVSKCLTTQEMKSAISHKVEDVFIFHKDFKSLGVKKNLQYRVKNIDTKNNEITLGYVGTSEQQLEFKINSSIGGFTTYEKKQLSCAVNDKLRATKNDRQMSVTNGQEFTVMKTEPDYVIVKSNSGCEIAFKCTDPVHFDHNYVNTVYSSQGKTCDRVFISGNQSFNKEALYVALSRAKQDVLIVTESKKEFLRSCETSKIKVSATNLIPTERYPETGMMHRQSSGKGVAL